MAQPNMAQMKKYQVAGAALPPKKPGGRPRFQINNRTDLHNAIHAVGRARPNTPQEHDMVRRYIRKRARALGLESMIPATWSSSGGSGASGS